MKDSTFITRVFLKNYKSIAACDVQLGPLTFLVGRNGSGKSNFLDALRFVADALNSSLEHAIRNRGGIKEVRRRSTRPTDYLSIHLNFNLPNGSIGYYFFRVKFHSREKYMVQTEVCRIESLQAGIRDAFFRVDNGTVIESSVKVAPPAVTDRLYLVNASGLHDFRPVYDAFSRSGFYNPIPDKIRDLQAPDPGNILIRDGSNLTSVFATLPPRVVTRIEEYLAAVVPGVCGVKVKGLGPKETLVFKQNVAHAKNAWQFLASNVSDGTLRALGILVALFQEDHGAQKRVSLVGIEEPELTLHPAAAGVLLDALRDAAHKTQVIITSHSPDLLDNKELDVESILAVESHDGTTEIAGVDEVGRSVVRDKLFTMGELLRRDQLQPDPIAVAAARAKRLPRLDLKSKDLT